MKKALLALTALSMSMAVSACGMYDHQNNSQRGDWHGNSDERMDRMAEGFFNRLDKNSDGVVTKSEYKEYTSRWFADADTNHDGKLTLDEVKAKFRKEKMKHHRHHPDDATANGDYNNAAQPQPPFEPRPQ